MVEHATASFTCGCSSILATTFSGMGAPLEVDHADAVEARMIDVGPGVLLAPLRVLQQPLGQPDQGQDEGRVRPSASR